MLSDWIAIGKFDNASKKGTPRWDSGLVSMRALSGRAGIVGKMDTHQHQEPTPALCTMAGM